MTHFADINILVRVYFNDDGGNDLGDQALDAAASEISLGELESYGMEIVGGVQRITRP